MVMAAAAASAVTVTLTKCQRASVPVILPNGG